MLAVCVPWRVLIFLTARTCICVTRCTNVSASGSRVQVPPRQEGCAGKLEPQCAQNSTEGWHVALKAASATMSSMMHAGAPRPLTILRGRFRMHRHALSDGDRPSCPAGADCAYKDRNGPPFFFRLTGEPARFLAQFFNLNYSDYTEIHLLKRDDDVRLLHSSTMRAPTCRYTRAVPGVQTSPTTHPRRRCRSTPARCLPQTRPTCPSWGRWLLTCRPGIFSGKRRHGEFCWCTVCNKCCACGRY